MSNLPCLIMMIGISGSGKSTVAKSINAEFFKELYRKNDMVLNNVPVVHSSDELRKELYGDDEDQSHNTELFIELHKRIKKDLYSYKDVVYDATNINKKLRVDFLKNQLKNVPCKKIAVCVMTQIGVCYGRNAVRSRHVPDHAMRRMYLNWQPPHYHEGFDEIFFVFDETTIYTSLDALYDAMNNFNQENSHHALTLGEHCEMASRYCAEQRPQDTTLYVASKLHDIGKLFTKTRINSRGIEDGDCHYYQHHCVGAYEAVFAMHRLLSCPTHPNYKSAIDILNLIYYHMHPFMSWADSERSMKKDRELIGEKMFDQISILHEADLIAH